MQEGVPPVPESDEAAEGTAAHLVAMKWGQGFSADWGLGRKFKIGDREWVIDDDMVDGAIMYAQNVSPAGRFEETVAIDDIAPGNWSTPDWFLNALHSLGWVSVVEYKYGYSPVEVWENWQLIAQACGICRFLNLGPETPLQLKVVQPRAYHRDGPVREWKTTYGELIGLAEVAARQVELALGSNPPANTGKHCGDCAAAYACSLNRQATTAIMERAGHATADDMPLEAVGQELRLLKQSIKRLEKRYEALHAHAENQAKNNAKHIPFWTLEPKQTRLAWKEDAPVERIALVGEMAGMNLYQPRRLITPTQARDKGLDPTILDLYSSRPKGALTLKPDDTHKLRLVASQYQRKQTA